MSYITSFILFFSMILSGCGFQLRGTQDVLPSIFQQTYLADNSLENEQLRHQVKQQLHLNGGQIVDKKLATVSVSLSPISEDSRQVAIAGAGTLKEYERTYRVTVTVVDLNSQVQLGSRTINVVRNIQLDDSKVLAGEERSDVLRSVAERSLSQQIMQYFKSF